MPQLTGGCVDATDDALSAPLQGDCFTTAVELGIGTLDPAGIFQAMEQVHEGRFLNAEPGGNFRLRDRLLGQREMEEGPPFGLAHAEGLKPFIQLQAPGASRAMKKRAKRF